MYARVSTIRAQIYDKFADFRHAIRTFRKPNASVLQTQGK